MTQTKIGHALHELQGAENQLISDLRSLAEQHRDDHEIHHVARDLVRWSERHVLRLAREGERYDACLGQEPAGSPESGHARHRVRAAPKPLDDPGLALLWQLRQLYGSVAALSLDWEVLAQAARASKDLVLLSVAEECRPETQRQLKWAEAKLKETAAQALLAP